MNSRINNTKKALQNMQLKVVEVTIDKFLMVKEVLKGERRRKRIIYKIKY